MGLADRDYSRGEARGLGFYSKSPVAVLIAVNVAIWLLEVLLVHSEDNVIIRFLVANPTDIFENHYFWQPLTANFLHEPKNIFHLAGNMLALFIFGRWLEDIYGRLDFMVFYLIAGSVAILAEAALSYSTSGPSPVRILGASGAVMGVVALSTLHFPQRQLSLVGLVPIPAWLICILYVFFDLSGAMAGGTGVAHWAHLAGAAFGLLYWSLDLRWERIRSLARGVRRGPPSRRRRPRLVRDPEPPRRGKPPGEAPPTRDPVSARIDEILEKIARTGQESLTGEEMEYLKKNSGRYRSEG